LPHYYRHMAANPDSTICKFYGMHRVKMYHLRRKLHFVVMRSVVDTACKIHTMYDLKGSLVGRIASAKDRANGGVLKDQDLLDDGVKFKLGARRDLFIKQIEADSKFLAELRIMDYSLLVGIHDRTLRDSQEQPRNTSVDLGTDVAKLQIETGTSLDDSADGGDASATKEETKAAASTSTVKVPDQKLKPKGKSFTNGSGSAPPSPTKPSQKEATEAAGAGGAADTSETAGGVGPKSPGQARGRSSEPSLLHHHSHHKMPHSNTPLVREKSKPRGSKIHP